MTSPPAVSPKTRAVDDGDTEKAKTRHENRAGKM